MRIARRKAAACLGRRHGECAAQAVVRVSLRAGGGGLGTRYLDPNRGGGAGVKRGLGGGVCHGKSGLSNFFWRGVR